MTFRPEIEVIPAPQIDLEPKSSDRGGSQIGSSTNQPFGSEDDKEVIHSWPDDPETAIKSLFREEKSPQKKVRRSQRKRSPVDRFHY